MKTLLFIVAGNIFCSAVSAQLVQTYNIDSLRKVLRETRVDTNRVWALNNLSRNIPNSDTVLHLAKEAIVLSRTLQFMPGEAEAYNNIGYWFAQQGNYPQALENYLHAIKVAEQDNYQHGLKRSYNNISAVYCYLKDYKSAISYASRSKLLCVELNDQSTHSVAASWMSKAYLESGQTDSALKYAQESYEMANRINQAFPLFQATARLGEINTVQGKHQLAVEYLRLSLAFSLIDGRSFRIAGAHYQLASAFNKLGLKDSATFHARKAFVLSQDQNMSGTLLTSSLLLSELSESTNRDEALRFQKIALAAQQNLFSQEKNRQIEALNFGESMRQMEIQNAERIAKQERKHNLQFAAIALGVVIFVILFLVVSHTMVVNQNIIKFLGVLALLIVFEFINLLIHPLLGRVTHHSPLLMLIIMVGIAALLIPFHHRLEKFVIQHLVEKNKRIRLSAAKKILAAESGNTVLREDVAR